MRNGAAIREVRNLNIDAITRWWFQGIPIDGLQRLLFYQPHHAVGYGIGMIGLLAIARREPSARRRGVCDRRHLPRLVDRHQLIRGRDDYGGRSDSRRDRCREGVGLAAGTRSRDRRGDSAGYRHGSDLCAEVRRQQRRSGGIRAQSHGDARVLVEHALEFRTRAAALPWLPCRRSGGNAAALASSPRWPRRVWCSISSSTSAIIRTCTSDGGSAI